jgi:hypothetical protein
MKKIILLLATCLWLAPLFAQTATSADSLAYQLQRQKINTMLEGRQKKFGRYDESIRQHTGIFGLQTRKDIRRSNAILMDIARTDDSIFVQTKVLLSYRAFQQQQAEAKSSMAQDQNLAFMNTINRLRQQIDQMKQDAADAKKHYEKGEHVYLIALVLMLGSILLILFIKRFPTH